jgi:hypothetical protein
MLSGVFFLTACKASRGLGLQPMSLSTIRGPYLVLNRKPHKEFAFGSGFGLPDSFVKLEPDGSLR